MASKTNIKERSPHKHAEIIKVKADADQVACDGGVGPLGHPRVWYVFDGRTELTCHYCGRHFVKS